MVLRISKAIIIISNGSSTLPNKPPYRGTVATALNNTNNDFPYTLEDDYNKYCKYCTKTYKGKKYTDTDSEFREYNKHYKYSKSRTNYSSLNNSNKLFNTDYYYCYKYSSKNYKKYNSSDLFLSEFKSNFNYTVY